MPSSHLGALLNSQGTVFTVILRCQSLRKVTFMPPPYQGRHAVPLSPSRLNPYHVDGTSARHAIVPQLPMTTTIDLTRTRACSPAKTPPSMETRPHRQYSFATADPTVSNDGDGRRSGPRGSQDQSSTGSSAALPKESPEFPPWASLSLPWRNRSRLGSERLLPPVKVASP
ncbi:MAG: hypothetical protein ACJA2W_000990 [Planctomycetota bacterium]|jgi:hypothetical protein